MFDDIGVKIKTLAKVITFIGIAFSVIGGAMTVILGLMDESGALIFSGVLTAGLGSLSSWLGCFLLYGFGELVDQNEIQTELLRQMRNNIGASVNANPVFVPTPVELPITTQPYSQEHVPAWKRVEMERMQQGENTNA